MKLEGIIFDFNGVLWWDTHLQEIAWKRFSETIRGTPLSSEEIRTHVHGRNNRYTFEYLTGRSINGGELAQMIQQKESIYRQMCLDQGADFKLSPGAVELLDYLVEHDIPHTIATASEKTNLNFFVAHLHLERWFDLGKIVFDDGTRRGKPAPDFYLDAARELGLDPPSCIVVEDSDSGIEAARAAGIGHVVALGPSEAHERLGRLDGVNRVVIGLAELPKEQLFRRR